MKPVFTLLTLGLVLTGTLAGCGRTAGLPSAAAPSRAALQAASRAASLHPVIHDFWYVTAATFKPDARRPKLGTSTFTMKSLEGAKMTLSVVTFYNDAPRVLNESVLVKLDGQQLLDDTHIEDALTILSQAHPYRSVDGGVLDRAVDWLKDESFTRY